MSQLQSDILSRQRPRRVWDETLPDGRSLAETIRAKLTSPVTMPAAQPGQDVRYSVPGVQQDSQQTLLPATQATDEAPAQSASTYDPNSTATRPAIVGGSLEPDPLKRNATRIQTMMANPSREVNAAGQAGVSHPFSKKKGALLGTLLGLSQAAQRDPRLASVLAGGATGGVIGAVKPEAIQDEVRRGEVADAQGQLGQQQQIAKNQASLENTQAETRQHQLAPEIALAEMQRKSRYDRDRLKIQQDAATGRINAAQAQQKFNDLKLKQERELSEADRASREKIAAMPARETPQPAGIDNTPDIQTAQKQLDTDQAELAQHQAEMAQKEGGWKKQAETDYAAAQVAWNALDDAYRKDPSQPKPPAAPKRKDFFDQAQNGDPHVQSGEYAKVGNRVKELQQSIADNKKRIEELKKETRTSQSRRKVSARTTAPETHNFSIGAYKARNKGATDADAKAFASKNYPSYSIVP